MSCLSSIVLKNKTQNKKLQEDKDIQKEQQVQKFDWRKYLSHKWVARNIPFFLFLAMLAILYIYNGHYADKQDRKISTTEKHIRELEYEYKTIKSEVIFRSKASELIKAVGPLGLKELTNPPVLLSDNAEKK